MSDPIQSLPTDLIDPSPFQPRTHFDEARLRELADSLREQGVIQPIVVRSVADRYQVIAGERRLRAARLLEWETVPALVRVIPDEQALEAALVENLQREQLSVVETALAFERLARHFHLSHGEIARRTGKSRPAVANILRLLQLSAHCLDYVERGELTEGHARALLALPTTRVQDEMADWVVRNGMSVREAERRVRDYLLETDPQTRAATTTPNPRRTTRAMAVDPHTRSVEDELRRRFGTRVTIEGKAGKGTVAFEYYGEEDLQRLLEIFLRP